MSQIMKSLAESEQGYRASQVGITPTIQPSSIESRGSNIARLAILAVILPLIALSYVGFTTYTQWEQQTEHAYAEIEKQMIMANQPQSPQVIQLDYPEFSDLRTVSEIRLALGITSDSNETEAYSTVETVTNLSGPLLQKESEQLLTQQSSDGFQLNSLDLSELSPELAERVQSALDGTSEQYATTEADSEIIELVNSEARYKGVLPAMNLETHMYTSNDDTRWVKINGVEMHEGDWLDNKVQLLSISPREVTVRFEGERIVIPALYEWQG